MQKDITFEQNNVWRNNTYTGNWHFMVEGGRTRGHMGRVAISTLPAGRRQQHETSR